MYVLHVLICGDNGVSRDPLDVCFGDQLVLPLEHCVGFPLKRKGWCSKAA